MLVETAHAADGIAITLAPYVVGHVGSLPITATLVTTWLAMALLLVGAFLVGRNLQTVPGKMQNLAEVVVGGAYDFVATTLESRELARRYFPLIMTIFLSLLAMNWLGLLPGVTAIGVYHGEKLVPLLYPPATDLNLALAYAFVAVVVVQAAGIMALGALKYGSKFINFSSPVNFLVGIIELISEIGRLVSFSFRLFGNIFAGKVLLTVAIFFVPFILPIPILAFEFFVGLMQAGIFAFLTLIFIKLAVAEPHH
jgi:F-type H+-transporting ATPase subunit a